MIFSPIFKDVIKSPTRKIGARVNLFEGAALAHTFHHTDALKSFTVDRVGEDSKFFGFGVCQKLNMKLLDMSRIIDIKADQSIEIAYSYESGNTYFCCTHPLFSVTEVARDENTNEIDVTAYDAIYKASAHTVAELDLTAYTLEEFATACATILGLPIAFDGVDSGTLALAFEEGANFDGSETLRDALNGVAEATQTIYFVSHDNVLTFKRLTHSPVETISKSQYFTLTSGANITLATIASVTELGDNVSATRGEGATQYVRNNPFWELREDIASIVENALIEIGGLSINEIECKHRGNPLLEIGDCIEIETKDGGTAQTYVLNETIDYSGALSATLQWNFEQAENEAESNPANLGEAIKQTFAKVDKANKQIEMLVNGGDSLSSLRMDVNGIYETVSKIETTTIDALENVNESVAELKNSVEASITAEGAELLVKNELMNGVDKVTTATGFTFDENGLKVTKTNSEMSTEITEDGMKVLREGEEVLTANNVGVIAQNLHANTYLIVGQSSRFEDYEKDGETRTGCFWIGG